MSAASGPSGRSGSGSDAKLLPAAAAAALATAALPPGAQSPCAGADVVVGKGSRSYRSRLLMCGHSCGIRCGSNLEARPASCSSTAWAPAAWSPSAGAPASSAFLLCITTHSLCRQQGLHATVWKSSLMP